MDEIMEEFDEYIKRRNAHWFQEVPIVDRPEEDGAFDDRRQRVEGYRPDPDWKKVFGGNQKRERK